MKRFEEFLVESTKQYKFTLRFARELSDDDTDRVERFLGKYGLVSMSRVSVTPISKNPLFFDDLTNTEVSKVDVVTSYPLSADILRQQLSDLIQISIKGVLVHPEGFDPIEEIEKDDDTPALLNTPYDDKSDNGENYGHDFIKNFLKSLNKRKTVEVINALSVKPNADKPQEQMSTEEGKSTSVISGRKK